MKSYKPLFEEISVKEKVFEFFSKNAKPTDKQIHTLSDELGVDIHKFEEIVYELLGSFLSSGHSKDFKGDYDPKQLKMGVDIEMEHTTNKMIAEKIAMDHLVEIPDYYTRLISMEKEAKEK